MPSTLPPPPPHTAANRPPTPPPPGLRALNSLAKKLRARRVAAGALQLASPEVKFELGDDEAHDPIDVGVYQVRVQSLREGAAGITCRGRKGRG